jgi:hypothetical protein
MTHAASSLRGRNLRSQDIANKPNMQVAQTQQAFSGSQMVTRMSQNIYSAMSEGFWPRVPE